ncbi:MAG: hemerythrin domain-containing protein [Rhodospirillaceae bacterium]
MKWNASLETGIERIDAEHKHLFEFIKLIQTANTDQKRRFVTAKMLEDFYELTKVHYEDEEDLMFRADFNKLNSHIGEHSLLLNTLRLMIDDFARTNEAEPLLEYITGALSDHMKSEDIQLAEFVRAKRRAKAAAIAQKAGAAKGARPR